MSHYIIIIFFRSHCACDELLFRCLKGLTEKNQNKKSRIFHGYDADTASIASSIGNVYFNVLGIECAEPKYKKVCVNSTKIPEKKNGKTIKLFFAWSSKNNTEVIQCNQWRLDKSSTPRYVFRKPNRSFWNSE